MQADAACDTRFDTNVQMALLASAEEEHQTYE